tara:strand:+ start:565 stop:846 length:282 start_codon:yes stop_codon:yes gene_type:complete
MKNNKTGKSINEAYKPGRDHPHTFYRWCQDNGRRYVGAANYDEFEANAKAYEAYRELWFVEERAASATHASSESGERLHPADAETAPNLDVSS